MQGLVRAHGLIPLGKDLRGVRAFPLLGQCITGQLPAIAPQVIEVKTL